MYRIQGEDTVTVGWSWLQNQNPEIDWDTGFMHITRSDGRHFTIKPKHHTDTKKVQFKLISIKQIKKLVRKKDGELIAVRVAPQLKVLQFAQEYQDIIDEYE